MHTLVNKLIIYLLGIFKNFSFVKSKTRGKAIEETSALYREDGFVGLFSEIRFWDGPFYEIEKMLPRKGLIVELGCGEGILSNYIGIKEKKRKVVGVEISKDRAVKADRGLKNVKFRQGDALTYKIPKADVVLMSHMLHHLLSFDMQLKLIRNAKKALNKDGKLVIAEIDRGLTLKYILGYITDAFFVPILFEGTLYNFNFFHRPKNEWKKILEDEGFTLKFKKPLSGRPFPDILMEAYKK